MCPNRARTFWSRRGASWRELRRCNQCLRPRSVIASEPGVAARSQWPSQRTSNASRGKASSPSPDFFRRSLYTSANVIFQVLKRLSVGVEGLYGWKEVRSGKSSDVFRIQLGVTMAVFD